MVKRDDFWQRDRSDLDLNGKEPTEDSINGGDFADSLTEQDELRAEEDELSSEEQQVSAWELQENAWETQELELARDQQLTEQALAEEEQYQLRRRPVVRHDYRHLSPQRKFVFIMLFIFIACFCFYAGFGSSGIATSLAWEGDYISGKDLTLDTNAVDLGESGIKTILMVGCDARETGDTTGRTDTIMLAFVNNNDKSVKILSVPRDTYVTIPTTGGKTKVNHAYAYGGIPLTESTLENFLGVQIDNYMEIDFNGFAEVVEALGGVTMDVEMRMYTPWENIDLQPGEQVLNGQDALAYVRFREKTMGDIGRVDRQQKFIGVLADEIFSSENIWKLPEVINVLMDNVTTDLSTTEVLSLAKFVRSVGVENMEMVRLPGDSAMIGGVSYWIVEDEQIPDIVSYMAGNSGSLDGAGTTDQSTDEQAQV